ncbi:helix-turn-helix domain-containing protein [Streptomyces iakyrus]|uniref:helix-turn-helix domain-containing protein n=1 Tax=Streptomyces iakyrus TaxID=68219 RepID=UPI003805E0FB
MARALLLRLVHSLGAPATSSPTTRRAALHQRFLDALELHFRELHRVDDYAGLLGCSVRTLTRAAQDAGHPGAGQVIGVRRLLEARRLLGSARWIARAVAAHLNFPDPAGFGRFFRHHTGLTPAAWAVQAVTAAAPSTTTLTAPPASTTSATPAAGTCASPEAAAFVHALHGCHPNDQTAGWKSTALTAAGSSPTDRSARPAGSRQRSALPGITGWG